jgi:hypothetical protein
VTDRLHRWHDRAKLDQLRQKRWFAVWLVISFNNIFLVAGVSRMLYGLLVILPVYVTIRTGLGHGIFLAQKVPTTGAFKAIGVLEFPAYLLSAALGINATLQLLVGGVPGFRVALNQCAVGFAVVSAMLLAASLLEVLALQRTSPPFPFPEFDMNTIRAKALAALQNRQTVPSRHNNS